MTSKHIATNATASAAPLRAACIRCSVDRCHIIVLMLTAASEEQQNTQYDARMNGEKEPNT